MWTLSKSLDNPPNDSSLKTPAIRTVTNNNHNSFMIHHIEVIS